MHFDDLPVLGGGHPIVGHLLAAREDPLILLRRVSEERGDLLRVPMLAHAIGAALSPAALHDVLVAKARSFEKSPVLRTALEPLAGQGLFTSEGELWRKQRKLMAPLFQQRELERYVACMRDAAAQGARALPDGGVVDMARECTRITMSIAGRALFDTDTFGEADDIGDAITTALHWVHAQSLSLPLILQTMLRTAVKTARDDLPEPLRRAGDGLASALEKPVFLPGEQSRRMREA